MLRREPLASQARRPKSELVNLLVCFFFLYFQVYLFVNASFYVCVDVGVREGRSLRAAR